MTFFSFQAATAALVVATPLALSLPAQAQTRFSDVQTNYWAAEYIQVLADRGILSGFPDGRFGPNERVTRAQYAAMIQKAFPIAPSRTAPAFRDVSSNYWAASAIATAYQTGFLSGYPGNEFRAGENIPRVQVLVSLANGLGYNPAKPINESLSLFQDAGAIPSYAITSIAAATEQNLVVNYPNVSLLNPNQQATRAEVAAFIYQALSNQSQVATLASPYVARLANAPLAIAPLSIPAGTTLSVRYDTADKIYVAPNEPNPVPVTLTTAQAIQTQAGVVLIPAGSEIKGVIRSDDRGAQFFAEQLQLASGATYALSARSQVVTTQETIREGAGAGRIVRDAAIGAGAAAVISGVTGDRNISAVEVLGGAGAGAIFGAITGRKSATLFVVNPETDLTLTLDSALALQ